MVFIAANLMQKSFCGNSVALGIVPTHHPPPPVPPPPGILVPTSPSSQGTLHESSVNSLSLSLYIYCLKGWEVSSDLQTEQGTQRSVNIVLCICCSQFLVLFFVFVTVLAHCVQ